MTNDTRQINKKQTLSTTKTRATEGKSEISRTGKEANSVAEKNRREEEEAEWLFWEN